MVRFGVCFAFRFAPIKGKGLVAAYSSIDIASRERGILGGRPDRVLMAQLVDGAEGRNG